MIKVIQQDNLEFLRDHEPKTYDLIYIDPPFNTGKTRKHTQVRSERDDAGGRVGFGGHRYRTLAVGTKEFEDIFEDFTSFLAPRLIAAHQVLKDNGSLFLHLDYREVHYAKVMLDSIFGPECFINEIIWAYDYGGRSKSRYSAKHDNILWYAVNPKDYTFNFDVIDRIPYMAPGLVGPERAAKGKTITSCWWNTIVPTNGKEKTGYPTQKPLGILERIVKVHSKEGDQLLDFFAGSGSFGEAAAKHNRHCTLVDNNPEAIEVMKVRLKKFL